MTGSGHQSNARMYLLSHYISALKVLFMCRGIIPTSKTSETSETSETSKMSLNIQWNPRHLPFAKSSVEEVIDLQALFNDYWSSDERQFTMRGQS